MGRKIHPFLQRIGIIRTENSRWIAPRKDYGRFIYEDYEIRKLINSKFKMAAVSKIIIERLADRIRIRIHSARPGIIIGRHGSDIEKLREDINAMAKKRLR